MSARHKYGAKRTEVDGISFASKREAARYAELKLLEKAGEIKNLKLQPRYNLCVNGTKVGTYVADFEYMALREHPLEHLAQTAWVLTAEDVKGFATPMFKLKRRMFEAEYKSIRLVVSK